MPFVGLGKTDTRHWHPDPEVLSWLCDGIPSGARVLEIGPGTVCFQRADTFVDFVDVTTVPREKLVKCDIARDRLPFADKEFDFVYCRHMLEDMYDPFLICEEMSRVAKAGYIETPSPVAELCRCVDGDGPPYRGYHHHRFFVWEHDGALTFMSKYPLVEYIKCADEDLAATLRQGSKYWNTHYLWSGKINAKHLQSPLNFDIPRDYPGHLKDAVAQSMQATDRFWAQIEPMRKSA